MKGSGVGSWGRPGGCYKDSPTIRLPADGGSSDDTGSSSETDITEVKELRFSGATCGTRLKTC